VEATGAARGGPAGRLAGAARGQRGLRGEPGGAEPAWALRRSAETLEAPDDVLAALDRLPEGTTYHTVVEIWDALDRKI
jgi:hypothetical protein